MHGRRRLLRVCAPQGAGRWRAWACVGVLITEWRMARMKTHRRMMSSAGRMVMGRFCVDRLAVVGGATLGVGAGLFWCVTSCGWQPIRPSVHPFIRSSVHPTIVPPCPGRRKVH